MHTAASFSVLALVFASSACAVPRRPAVLPPRSEGYVAVLSGEMPSGISQVARHSWIVAHVPGEGFRRFEMGGGSSEDPFHYFGQGEVAVHGVVLYEPQELMRVVACLGRERRNYRKEYPSYFPIPGPNSNTIVDYMLRHCNIHVELPATAIGRDYRGLIGASRTSLGTGVQVETWVVGFKLGLEEGVELHVLDLPLGVHFWPPGITVPVNPGRIGIDDAMHRDSVGEPWRDDYRRENEAREYGLASLWLWSRYGRVERPEDAGGLSDVGTVGFNARTGLGQHVGYGFGADLEAGAGFPLGFAYAARLYPVGLALMLRDNTFVGAYAGIGSDGVTGHVPSRFQIPAELRLEIDIAPMARIGARAGVAWFPGSASRSGGSLLSPYADELVLSTFGRLGRSEPCGCPGRTGRGYFFALERREIMRTPSFGFTFGVEVDMGG
jgi:hypothetical protein